MNVDGDVPRKPVHENREGRPCTSSVGGLTEHKLGSIHEIGEERPCGPPFSRTPWSWPRVAFGLMISTELPPPFGSDQYRTYRRSHQNSCFTPLARYRGRLVCDFVPYVLNAGAGQHGRRGRREL